MLHVFYLGSTQMSIVVHGLLDGGTYVRCRTSVAAAAAAAGQMHDPDTRATALGRVVELENQKASVVLDFQLPLTIASMPTHPPPLSDPGETEDSQTRHPRSITISSRHPWVVEMGSP